ncbi:hypothetical protein DL95DRAFT_68140 [Leptodontidium sp. 2 PMI_412]|nr:hypothetical protein DL95DRAFT_68140 [Leptodontidium sp. 2 PMI_412]
MHACSCPTPSPAQGNRQGHGGPHAPMDATRADRRRSRLLICRKPNACLVGRKFRSAVMGPPLISDLAVDSAFSNGG